MRGGLTVVATVLAVAPAWFVGAPQNRATATPDDRYRGWAVYGGGPDQIRYSSLTQINRSNVQRLEVAWTFDSGESGGLQTNPIVVDRVLYTTTPSHKVVALDAASGVVRWTFDSAIEGRRTGDYAWKVPLGEYPELTAKGLRHQLRPKVSRVRQGDGRARVGNDAPFLGHRDSVHV